MKTHMMWKWWIITSCKATGKKQKNTTDVYNCYSPRRNITRRIYGPPWSYCLHACSGVADSCSRVHEIINEKRGISVDTALRLAKFFETDFNLWVNLQAQYEGDLMDVQKRTDMERKVPYRALQRASALL